MLSPLEGLPREILDSIINYVGYRGSRRSLANLAECSRLLHSVTIGSLYDHVEFTFSMGTVGSGIVPLRYFTRSVLAKPQLARLVRSFRLGGWNCEDNVKDPKSISVDEAFKVAITNLSRSKEQERDLLKAAGQKQNDDLLLALLLPALANLENLDLVIPSGTKYPEIALRQAVTANQGMNNNSSIELKCGMKPMLGELSQVNIAQWDIDHLRFYLQLPSVRKFIGVSLRRSDDINMAGRNLGSLKSNISSLQHLYLEHCNIDPVDLSSIFRACKNLITFSYGYGGGLSYGTFSLKEVQSALILVESTLKNLSLTHDMAYFEGQDDIGPISCMTGFKVLKNLKITMAFLFGDTDGDEDTYADSEAFPGGRSPSAEAEDGERVLDPPNLAHILPTSLETLHLDHCEHCDSPEAGRLVALLSELLTDKANRPDTLPNLRRISLGGYFAWLAEQKIYFELDALNTLANAAGVTLIQLDTGKGERLSKWPKTS